MVPVSGEIWMDDGAVRAVRQRGKSLFSAGILRASGGFGAQDCVLLCDAEGNAFAQGLSNYSHADVSRLKVCDCSDQVSGFLKIIAHSNSIMASYK